MVNEDVVSFMYPGNDENKEWPLVTVTPFARGTIEKTQEELDFCLLLSSPVT